MRLRLKQHTGKHCKERGLKILQESAGELILDKTDNKERTFNPKVGLMVSEGLSVLVS